MIVQLIINDEMIKCFYSCTQKVNYHPLFYHYKIFIENLTKNFKKVNFPANTYSREISENLTDIFQYIMNFEPYNYEPHNYCCENKLPQFFRSLREAMISNSWKNFYQAFRYVADIMIKTARSQGIIDLRIAQGSILYEYFVDRDMAMAFGTKIVGRDFGKKTIVTPAMINCFHGCTAKGDYQQLFKDFPLFFQNLRDNLYKVNIEDPFHSAIVKESKFLLYFFSTWTPNSDLPWENEMINPDLNLSNFFPNLALSMRKRNWDDFYDKYQPVFDFLIDAARRQKVIDLNVASHYGVFDNFEKRDEFGLDWYHPKKDKSPKQVLPTPNTTVLGLEEIKPVKTAEVKQTFQNELGPTRVTEVKATPKVPFEPNTEDFQVYQKEEISKLESRIQKLLKEQLELIRFETARKHTNAEKHFSVLEENQKFVETSQKNLKTHFDQKLNDINALFDEKFQELSEKNQNVDEKIKKAVVLNQSNMKVNFSTLKANLMNIMEERLSEIEFGPRAKNEHSESSNKTLEDQMKLLEEQLVKKMEDDYFLLNEALLNKKLKEITEKSAQEQKKQSKLNEISEQKLEDLVAKVERNALEREEKLKLKEETLDKKIEAVKVKEELLDRKIEAVLGLIKVLKQQSQLKVVAAHCSENSKDCSSGPESESTDRFQAIEEKTEPDARHFQSTSVPTPSNLRSLPISDLLDDEELQQMEEDYQKQLAEQKRRNDAELEQLQERGRQKNKKAKEEIRELERSVSRASSFRL